MFVKISRHAVAPVLVAAGLWLHPACRSAHHELEPAGEYRRPHTIRYFDGDAIHELEKVDTLVLSRAGRGGLRFAIETVADNGHLCSVEGVASPVGDHFEFRETLDLDPRLTGGKTLECRLRVEVGERQIKLHDVDHNCRLYYCGMRAKLDGLVFVRMDGER